jgi:ribosomal protein S18 acetylase RimI-like enzyme
MLLRLVHEKKLTDGSNLVGRTFDTTHTKCQHGEDRHPQQQNKQTSAMIGTAIQMLIKVRPALASDVKALAELADKLIPREARTSDRIRVLTRSLRKPNYHLYVAEKDKQLLGFVDLWVFSDFAHAGRMGIIQNLFVDREVRRLGIGDLLMKHVTGRASQLKLKELHVWTSFENRAAISLYRKNRLTKRSLLLEREFERG